MSSAVADRTDRALRALADPTRRDILARSLRAELSIGELAGRYPISVAAVQRHVAVLEGAGLVTKRVAHRHRYVRGVTATVDDVVAVLQDLRAEWSGRLDRFEAELTAGDDA